MAWTMNKVLFFLTLIVFTSCTEVTIRLKNIPDDTPSGSLIYVSGNFNYWDPGDTRFRMKKIDSNTYEAKVPKGFGKMEFKFTRGDWTTVEVGPCGMQIPNRVLPANEEMVECELVGWQDLKWKECPQLTLIINQYPAETQGNIYVLGDFNEWTLADESLKFEKRSDGNYVCNMIILNKGKTAFQDFYYSFNRGNLSTEAIDAEGNTYLNQKFRYENQDTAYFKIDGWKDMALKMKPMLTFKVKIQEQMHLEEDLFLASNINNWQPGNSSFRLKKVDHHFFITIPRPQDPMQFKFTRGNWKTVECDNKGKDIENRIFHNFKLDTITIEISGFKDLF
jgi:hypothetical protein